MIEPLILAAGSHNAGTGKACAMNVISWENGDTTITDLPDCTARVLAVMVMSINDEIGDGFEDNLLPTPWSTMVMDLAHSTVGTNVEMTQRQSDTLLLRYLMAHTERLTARMWAKVAEGQWNNPVVEPNDAAFIDMVKDSVRIYGDGQRLALTKVDPVRLGTVASYWWRVHNTLIQITTTDRVWFLPDAVANAILSEAWWPLPDDHDDDVRWTARIARATEFVAEYKRDLGITTPPVTPETFEEAYAKAMVVAG
jgi:hypothetical protein